MIPYCDSPKQSLGIAVAVGIIAGFVGVVVKQLPVVLMTVVLLTLVLEIGVHEYRQDDQYVEAKQQFRRALFK